MAEPYGGYPPPDLEETPYEAQMNMANFMFGNIENDGSLTTGSYDRVWSLL